MLSEIVAYSCRCRMADGALSPLWFQLRNADTVPTNADHLLGSSVTTTPTPRQGWELHQLLLASQSPPEAVSLESSGIQDTHLVRLHCMFRPWENDLGITVTLQWQWSLTTSGCRLLQTPLSLQGATVHKCGPPCPAIPNFCHMDHLSHTSTIASYTCAYRECCGIIFETLGYNKCLWIVKTVCKIFWTNWMWQCQKQRLTSCAFKLTAAFSILLRCWSLWWLGEDMSQEADIPSPPPSQGSR